MLVRVGCLIVLAASISAAQTVNGRLAFFRATVQSGCGSGNSNDAVTTTYTLPANGGIAGILGERICGGTSVKGTLQITLPTALNNGTRQTVEQFPSVVFPAPIPGSASLSADIGFPQATGSEVNVTAGSGTFGGTCPNSASISRPFTGSSHFDINVNCTHTGTRTLANFRNEADQIVEGATVNYFAGVRPFGSSPAGERPSLTIQITAVYTLEAPENLAIDHIQVTQSVQTPNNSATLIRGRDSVVRVFVRSTGNQSIDKVGGEVTVGSVKLTPLNTEGISAEPRVLLDSSRYSALNFALPAKLANAATVQLRASVWFRDDAGEIAAEDTADNVRTHSAAFEPSTYPAVYSIGQVRICAPSLCAAAPPDVVARYMQQYLPAQQVKLLPVPFPKITTDPQLMATREGALFTAASLARELEAVHLLTESFGLPWPHQVIFALPDSVQGDIDNYVDGPLGNIWLATGSLAKYVHGLAHNLGLRHYAGVSALDTPITEQTRPVMWNFVRNQVYGLAFSQSGANLTRTLMHRPPSELISPGEWNELHRRGPLASPPPADAPLKLSTRNAVPEREVIIVSGTVARDGSTGTLDPAIRARSTVETLPSDPTGDTCIRFSGGSTHCFPATIPEGSDTGFFTASTAFPNGTTSVTLVRNGRDLATLQTGAAPQVTIVAPLGGETWQGQQKLRWTAVGSNLRYVVQYSPDNGTSWLALPATVAGTEAEFNTADLLGGTQVRFRVIASAGLDTTTAVSQAVQISTSGQLSVSATSVDFGNLQVGNAGTRNIEVRNTGTGLLRASITAPANVAFSMADAQFLIPAGESALLPVTFTPTAEGALQSSLRVNNQEIALRGTAFANPVASIDVAPDAGALGQVQSGQTKDRAIVVRNAGTADLQITGATFTGGGFATSGPALPVTVPAGNAINLIARITATGSGTMNGQLTIASNDPSRAQLQVPLSAQVVNGPLPATSAAGVLNAASFQGGAVSPGEIVTIFGSNIGPANLATLQLTPQGTVATQVANTRVLFDGVPAPIVYALAGQTSVVVPYAVGASGQTQMEVEYEGRRSDPVKLDVASAGPGLFSANSSGTGQGAIVNANGTINGPSNPAPKGSFVILFGTGEGQTLPEGVDGRVTGAELPRPIGDVTVTIGGVAAQVLYAGEAPGLVSGVLQVNVIVPENAPSGNQPVVVTVGGSSSQAGLTMAVQ